MKIYFKIQKIAFLSIIIIAIKCKHSFMQFNTKTIAFECNNHSNFH